MNFWIWTNVWFLAGLYVKKYIRTITQTKIEILDALLLTFRVFIYLEASKMQFEISAKIIPVNNDLIGVCDNIFIEMLHLNNLPQNLFTL